MNQPVLPITCLFAYTYEARPLAPWVSAQEHGSVVWRSFKEDAFVRLVQWLQAQHVLCVPVDAALRASYGYTCSSCMPQVADEE